MQGQRLGYVRVSRVVQNPERQLDGLGLDRASRKNTPMAQLVRR